MPGVRTDRGWYLSVEYTESGSRKFRDVLKRARECERFQAIIDESGRVVYRNLVRRDRLADFKPVFDALRDLKCSMHCTVEGHEFPAEDLGTLLVCALPRVGQPRCAEFTPTTDSSFSLGCDRYLLFVPGVQSSPEARFWWEFGGLDRSGVLKLDRQAMKTFLLKGTYTNAFCPMADRKLAISIIDALPNTVDVRERFNWEVLYRHRLTASEESLFAGRWPAVPPPSQRPPDFGTTFFVRDGGGQAVLTGLDGGNMGRMSKDGRLSHWLRQKEEFLGIALWSNGRDQFEFVLVAEFVPEKGVVMPESFHPALVPERTPSYMRYVKKLFNG